MSCTSSKCSKKRDRDACPCPQPIGSNSFDRNVVAVVSGNKTLLLQFHRLAAALNRSVAAPGDNELGAALLADIPFSDLVSHLTSILSMNSMVKNDRLSSVSRDC